MHQFDKVELVAITTPETSYDVHESLTRDAEAILQALELPYRVLLLAAGDMGNAAAKTYDIEVWAPGVGMWLEASSCSNCEAYQSRRAGSGTGPGVERDAPAAHAERLGSGSPADDDRAARERQNADGTVTMPPVLRPYLGGRERLEPGAMPGRSDAHFHHSTARLAARLADRRGGGVSGAVRRICLVHARS